MMKLYDYKEYEYDENKQEDLMVSCIGKRGKFTGIAETRIHLEEVGGMKFYYMTTVKYTAKGKNYTSCLATGVTKEKYSHMMEARPDLYKRPYLEHLIYAGLNNAYEHYKKYIR